MLKLTPPRRNARFVSHLLYSLYTRQQGVVRASLLISKGTPAMLSAEWETEPVKVFKSEDRYYAVYEIPLPFIAERTAYAGQTAIVATRDPRLHVEYLGANWPTGDRALVHFTVPTGFNGKEKQICR